MSGHSLDWSSQPEVFKAYRGAPSVPLPEEMVMPREPLREVLRGEPQPGAAVGIEKLARILALTQALTAKTRHGGVDIYYRSVASAGALYPTELYCATKGAPGIEDGLYHHTVALRALTRLRTGSVVNAAIPALRFSRDDKPALVFFFTAIFFRSSWKYRDRAYRYHLLDTGHMTENLVLALKSEQLAFELSHDFVDGRINDLLAVDPEREVCLAVAGVWEGRKESSSDEEISAPVTGAAGNSRVSGREIDYPSIKDIHNASTPIAKPQAELLPMVRNLALKPDFATRILPPESSPEVMSYAEAVMKRRSMRNLVREQLASDAFRALLTALSTDVVPLGTGEAISHAAVAVGFLVGNVEGVEPGFYLLDRAHSAVACVKSGLMVEEMAQACLGQAWLANSALHFLFLANLESLEKTWGSRGYRYAMMSAGRLGQRLYLAATSMRLGCCGIGAYYDEEAAGLLGLDGETRLLYLAAVGPVRRFL